MTRPPAHHRRALAALRGRGIGVERLRLPRPGAGGEAAGVRVRPPSGEARGRVVVVHGMGSDALFPLAGLFEALAGEGWEAAAWDVDGQGWESTTRFSPSAARGALPAMLAAAAAMRPRLPLHLVGHSLGGALVLDTLASGDDLPPVRSAVLVSTPVRFHASAGGVVREALGLLRPRVLAERRRYGLWGLVPAAGPVKRRAFPFRLAADAPGSYLRAVRALLDDLRPEDVAARVPHPVLVVHGTADGLVPAEAAERLARALPGADLLLLPGATHYTTLICDEAGERILAHLRAHSREGRPSGVAGV